MAWVMRCMEDGVNPRSILAQIIPDENDIPDVDDYILWKLVVNLVSEPPPRNKLPDINTLEDVVNLLQKCEKIMVLTGAGVSCFLYLLFFNLYQFLFIHCLPYIKPTFLMIKHFFLVCRYICFIKFVY
jgi:hypothetical protein